MKKVKSIYLLPFILLGGCSSKQNAFDFTSGGKKLDVFDEISATRFAKNINNGFNKSYEALMNNVSFNLKIENADIEYFFGNIASDVDVLNGYILSFKNGSGVIDVRASDLNKKVKDANVSVDMNKFTGDADVIDVFHNDKKKILSLTIKNNSIKLYANSNKYYADFTGDKMLSILAPLVKEFLDLDPALINKLIDSLESKWDLTKTVLSLSETVPEISLLSPEYSLFLDDIGDSLLGICQMQIANDFISINEYKDKHYELHAHTDSSLLNTVLSKSDESIFNESTVFIKTTESFYFNDDTKLELTIKTNKDFTLDSIGLSGRIHLTEEIIDENRYLFTPDIIYEGSIKELNVSGNISLKFDYNEKEVSFPDFKQFDEFPITLFL